MSRHWDEYQELDAGHSEMTIGLMVITLAVILTFTPFLPVGVVALLVGLGVFVYGAIHISFPKSFAPRWVKETRKEFAEDR